MGNINLPNVLMAIAGIILGGIGSMSYDTNKQIGVIATGMADNYVAREFFAKEAERTGAFDARLRHVEKRLNEIKGDLVMVNAESKERSAKNMATGMARLDRYQTGLQDALRQIDTRFLEIGKVIIGLQSDIANQKKMGYPVPRTPSTEIGPINTRQRPSPWLLRVAR